MATSDHHPNDHADDYEDNHKDTPQEETAPLAALEPTPEPTSAPIAGQPKTESADAETGPLLSTNPPTLQAQALPTDVEEPETQSLATTDATDAADATPEWDRPTLPRVAAITRRLAPLTIPLAETNPLEDATLKPTEPLAAVEATAEMRPTPVDQQDTLALPSVHPANDTAQPIAPDPLANSAIRDGELFLLPPVRLSQMRRELAENKNSHTWRYPVMVGALIIVVAVPLLFALSRSVAARLDSRHAPRTPTQQTAAETPDTPAAWALDTVRTPLNAQDAVFAQQHYAVAPAFQAYYRHRDGAVWLGVALTPAFPTAEGLAQFFTDGALLLPGRLDADDVTETTGDAPGVTSAPGATNSSEDAASAPGDISPQLVRDGVYDAATGVEWLPLAHTLLTVGSEAPVIADKAVGVVTTYLTLRAATAPADMTTAPPGSQTAPTPTTTGTSTPTATQTTTPTATPTPFTAPVFVAEATQDGQTVGHTIPAAIWNAINDPQVSPDGWQVDFGDPLTEAIPLTTTTPDGQVHHALAQLFWEGALIFDPAANNANPAQGASGALAPLALGQAYLQTLGAPTPSAPKGQQIWATGDMAVLTAPTSGQAEVHIGQNFPLTITGGQWRQGALWYAVSWQSLRRSGNGWAAATALTLSPPGLNMPVWASFDALSPALADYLNGEGANVGAVVYDLTRNTYYTYNPQGEFVMASSAKVSLMTEDLAGIEAQGGSPGPGDIATLTAMIEHSDNDAAQSIYETHSYDYGVYTYLESVGITDYLRNPNGWGFGEWSPLSMVRLLTMLQEGQLLNASDTALALSLMSNIEPDQRNGVGDTAPSGATYAMKDGWTPAEDGLWAVNTSGIVTVGKETYIIAVYTQEQYSLDGGWDITRQVCGPIGKLLA